MSPPERRPSLVLLLAASLWPAGPQAETIVFGSCLRQWQPQPVWQAIRAAEPDAFVFVGDNVYTDTGPNRLLPEPERIELSYQALAESPGFRALRETAPVYGTWDDHDYGRNDAGADYPWKEASKAYFMAFFEVPAADPMRGREGIYAVRYLGRGAERIQLLLLDTRTFRGPLTRAEPTPECPRIRYAPNQDEDATLLGEAQWRWLGARLREPAALRILVSSIQVIPDRHCFEKWANLPRERRRLLELIRDTGAGGVVLVSGDRHLAEISVLPPEAVGYPLHELTTSGLNSGGAGAGEHNPYRTTAASFPGDNFGLVRLDRAGPQPQVVLEVRDAAGGVALSEAVLLRRLAPGAH
jgi:alkaline phosphatase D